MLFLFPTSQPVLNYYIILQSVILGHTCCILQQSRYSLNSNMCKMLFTKSFMIDLQSLHYGIEKFFNHYHFNVFLSFFLSCYKIVLHRNQASGTNKTQELQIEPRKMLSRRQKRSIY